MNAIKIVLAVSVLALLSAGKERVCAQTSPAVPAFRLKAAGKLPEDRQMHGSAVVGTRLYIFGGCLIREGQDFWDNSVISAEVKPGGELGPWRNEQAMPERRHYIGNSVEVVNNRIYIVGGEVAPEPRSPHDGQPQAEDILWTGVLSDGTLLPWQKSRPFPGLSISCSATCVTDRHLYVLGGLSKGKITDRIFVAPIEEGGSPGEWKEQGTLPTPLWFHGAAMMDDSVYVWGGLTDRQGTVFNGRVFAAKANKDGTLSAWHEAGTMSTPVAAAAFCGFNDYLVAVGGRLSGKGVYSTQIWFCRLENQRADYWKGLNTDIEAMMYLGLGLDHSRGIVLINGGHRKNQPGATGEDRLVSVVQAFQLPQPQSSVLQLQKASAPIPQQPAAGPREQQARFQSLIDALNTARQTGKPVLAFFHSPQVPACKRFWTDVAGSASFGQMVADYCLAEVDVSQQGAQMMYKFQVFKVPAMAILEPDGSLRRVTTSLLTAEDLKTFLDRR